MDGVTGVLQFLGTAVGNITGRMMTAKSEDVDQWFRRRVGPFGGCQMGSAKSGEKYLIVQFDMSSRLIYHIYIR